MKRKIMSVLLCVSLLFALSFNALADVPIDEIQDAQTISVLNETTINTEENREIDVSKPMTHIDDHISLAPTAVTPIGYLDTVNSSIIGGWAYQSDIPNTALTVHIYIINNSTGQQRIIPVTANGYRADLAAAGYGSGYHAFQYNISWKTYKPGTYTVRAYAISPNNSNPQLANSPKTFTVRNMAGVIDEISSTKIKGWAWKPDAPNETIGVHAHIIQGSTVLEIKTAQANTYRQDLQNAGYGNGYHGFSIPIDWTQYPEERLRLIVYMYDGSGHSPVLYDGYYENGEAISIPTNTYVWPTESRRVTQVFNSIPPYTAGHYGVDIGATTRYVPGDKISCFADGYVSRSGYSSSYGYVVYINHINPNPSISTYIQTKYAHMSSNLLVSVNTNITKGTQLGYMDNTGESLEVHLHFETVKVPSMTTIEISNNREYNKSFCIDPLRYFVNNEYTIVSVANVNGDNLWGLIFDINEIEIDVYDRTTQIIIEEPIAP